MPTNDTFPPSFSVLTRHLDVTESSVIEPLLSGADLPPVDAEYDDVSYAQDLGLLAPGTNPQVGSPIYREVIVRLLIAGTQRAIRESSAPGQAGSMSSSASRTPPPTESPSSREKPWS